MGHDREDFSIKISNEVDPVNGHIIISDNLNTLLREVIQTKEKLIRDGLIKLGWIPPEASAPIIIMRSALELSAQRFEEYAKNHLAKVPPDTAKAKRNTDAATTCRAAIRDFDQCLETIKNGSSPKRGS